MLDKFLMTLNKKIQVKLYTYSKELTHMKTVYSAKYVPIKQEYNMSLLDPAIGG